jgi:hypothetical protein
MHAHAHVDVRPDFESHLTAAMERLDRLRHLGPAPPDVLVARPVASVASLRSSFNVLRLVNVRARTLTCAHNLKCF